GGYGYPRLTEYAASLEQSARQQAIDACEEQIDEIKRICDRVVVTVQT
ncbi:MAG: Hpt domain-containing protein, partial [Planctomycetes bacterium]|nr:Hpt domain-containing protein [Planctomycetota bacterium]